MIWLGENSHLIRYDYASINTYSVDVVTRIKDRDGKNAVGVEVE